MKRAFFAICFLVFCFASLPHAGGAAAERGWQPARTWLFVVGVIEWKHSEMFGSFPQKQRRDTEMVEFFKKAGVPAAQIVYLKDKQATQERIDSAFADQLKKVREGDLLLVCYAGHGSRSKDGRDTFLASYDSGDKGVLGWSVNSIPATIDNYPAVTRVLWVIDCCYSGYAADVIASGKHRAAYACAASSSASESSTGHWTFTQAFLDALRGTAYVDLNRDGQVTVAEFATHADRDMILGEEQKSSFATAGNFDAGMVLASAEPLANPRVGERVKAKAEGKWWPARIVEVKEPKVKVHFIGYGEEDDVTVDPATLRPITPTQYAVGSKVDVLWKKVWYPATVRKVKEGVHFIHYDDYGDEWDEWASSKRIRLRKNS